MANNSTFNQTVPTTYISLDNVREIGSGHFELAWSIVVIDFILFFVLCCSSIIMQYVDRRLVNGGFYQIINGRNKSENGIRCISIVLILTMMIVIIASIYEIISGSMKVIELTNESNEIQTDSCYIAYVEQVECDNDKATTCNSPECCGKFWYYWLPKNKHCDNEYIGKQTQSIYWKCSIDCSQYWEDIDDSLVLGHTQKCYGNEEKCSYFMEKEDNYNVTAYVFILTVIILILICMILVIFNRCISYRKFKRIIFEKKFNDAHGNLCILENWMRKYCQYFDNLDLENIKQLITSYAVDETEQLSYIQTMDKHLVSNDSLYFDR